MRVVTLLAIASYLFTAISFCSQSRVVGFSMTPTLRNSGFYCSTVVCIWFAARAQRHRGHSRSGDLSYSVKRMWSSR